jgi:poly(3-hydroxybutyrate) depolymerase
MACAGACASDGADPIAGEATRGMSGSPAVGEPQAVPLDPAGSVVPGSEEDAAGLGGEAQDPAVIANPEPGAGDGEGDGAFPEPPTGSAGCGQASPPLAAGDRALTVDGVARSYVLDLPNGYDGERPYPIVFAFHGATTSGRFFRSAFYGNLLSTMADEAILVHPDALGDPSAWDNQADVPFFDALLTELSAALCVDEARVFATGHSSGGFFTNTLGCQRGDVLRAIAPISGGGPFGFGAGSCTGQVAVWVAHAENDETVAFENGENSRDRWLSANACSPEIRPITPDPCVEYSGCAAGSAVRWCVYQDGHDWPDFAPAGIWDFFRDL